MTALISRISPSLETFLTWWFGELRALVPPRLRQLFNSRAERLEIAFSSEAARLRWFRKRGAVDLGSVAIDEHQAALAREDVRRLLASARNAGREVDIVLPNDRLVETSLEFPAAAEADLQGLLTFEMDRLTPFQAEDVYFESRVLHRNREEGRIRIGLVVVPRSVVDRAVSVVQAWGLTVNRVVGQSGVPGSPRWVIIGSGSGRRMGRLQTGVAILLGAAALALLVAIVYVPLQHKRQQVEALGLMIAEARAVAVEAADLQNRINNLRSQKRFLTERKQQQPPFVAVLDKVTEVFPDDTWLFRLRFRAGEVETYGYSQAASDLVKRIGGSAMFRDPSFRAPVMRDPATDAERFHLTFRVVSASAEAGPQ